MLNKKIYKEEVDKIHPELWDYIIDDWYVHEKDHRKYSSFYISIVYKIDEEMIADFKNWCSDENVDLAINYLKDNIGYWMTTEDLYWSDSEGLYSTPTELVKVFQKEKIVITKEWVVE